MATTLKRYDNISWQIWKDGVVIALIIQYTNNKWGINDRNDKHITGASFVTVEEAYKFYQNI